MTEAQAAEVLAYLEQAVFLLHALGVLAAFGLAGVFWRLLVLAKNQREIW